MIEYLYTGQLRQINKQIAMDLLGLSNNYKLDSLKSLCENTLMQNIDNKSAISLLIVASQFDSVELKKSSIQHLIKNFKEISGS